MAKHAGAPQGFPVITAPAVVVSPVVPSPEERADTNTRLEGAREDAQTTAHGQRRVNLIWEHVQAYLAVYVITLSVLIAAYVIVTRPDAPIAEAAFLFITNTASGIVGYYFSRTNHTAIGGLGEKGTDGQPYVGR